MGNGLWPDSKPGIKANMSNLIRTETHDGEDYLIAPAILIREGVHNGIYYSANELAKFPEAWDGRPVVVYHPTTLQGRPKSANSPSVEKERTIGKLYNTEWDPTINGLRSEVWINKKKCRTLAGDILARLEADRNLDVSTGLFTDDILEEGKWNEESFNATATNFRPDHLAVLPDGHGACSWDDGAGMPRINQQKDDTQGEGQGKGESMTKLEAKAVLQALSSDHVRANKMEARKVLASLAREVVSIKTQERS